MNAVRCCLAGWFMVIGLAAAAATGLLLVSAGAELTMVHNIAGLAFGQAHAAQAGARGESACAGNVAPAYKAYAVAVDRHGKRPALQRDSKFSNLFRTRLSEALRDMPVNFAGHYVVTEFGCGSGCVHGGIIDTRTGQAHELPWPVYVRDIGDWDSPFRHEAGSRLFAVRGVLKDMNEPPLERYFVWTGKALEPVCTRRLQVDQRTGDVR